MRLHRDQQGLSLLGFLMILAVVGFAAFIGMKLFPVYSEYFSVKSAMKGVAEEAGAAKLSSMQIQDRLARRFDISYVKSIQSKDIKLARTKSGGKVIWAKYEVRKPLIGNLDFVAKFDEKVPLGNKAGVD